MEKYQFFVATLLLLLKLTHATVILEHPKDVEAVPNEWVQFNCTVTDCNTYHVRWYIAGRSHPLNDNINSVPGLVFRRSSSICTSSTQRTHFIEVQANQAFDKSAFYCGVLERSQEAASQCRCTSRWCYSTPALLIVNTTTTSSLTSTCMTETTPVPSPSCTVQGLTSTEIITMTSTVTVSVTPTPTNFPNSGPTTCAHMQNSSTQANSVNAAVLAGLGIAAFILLL